MRTEQMSKENETFKSNKNISKPVAAANAVGKCVSDTACFAALTAACAVSSGAAFLAKKLVPKLKEVFVSIKNSLGSSAENTASMFTAFLKRRKEVGTRQAFAMIADEVRESKETKRRLAVTAVNYGLPIASVCALAAVISAETSVDYAVAVEYKGQELGLVAADSIMEEAKQEVQSKITYYDVDENVYQSASIAVKAVSAQDEVISREELAQKLEEQLPELATAVTTAEQEEKKAVSIEPTKTMEDNSGKVRAYSVTVDGEFIGAVEDYSRLEAYFEDLKSEYADEDVVDVEFNKDIEYDTENFVKPEDVRSSDYYINIFNSIVSEPVYYEVQLGDNPWNIARDNDMTLDELKQCVATSDGEIVPDITKKCNVGTIIQLSQEVKYLQPEIVKEETFQVGYHLPEVQIKDDTMFIGMERVDTEGTSGIMEYHVYATYADGVKVSEENIDEPKIIEEATAKVVRVGTIEPSTYVSKGTGGSGDYYWPVSGGKITSYMGDGRGHKGIDVGAPYGTPIYAAEEGKIIETGSGWNGGYGNCIRIQHPDGNVTVYAHQSSLAVSYGEYVVKGQLIGYVGSTGDSSGNHLHFEVRSNGRYLDPLDFVSQY